MTNVGKLIELLSAYPLDMIITDEQNQEFVHMVNMGDNLILSTSRPIGYCNRSGEYVYKSMVKGYIAFSPAMDEDLYGFEFTPFIYLKFDEDKCNVVSTDNKIKVLYTDETTPLRDCSDDVVERVVDIYNKTRSIENIDEYLLDAPCTTEHREYIIEQMAKFFEENIWKTKE
jgi:hypothetical protein